MDEMEVRKVASEPPSQMTTVLPPSSTQRCFFLGRSRRPMDSFTASLSTYLLSRLMMTMKMTKITKPMVNGKNILSPSLCRKVATERASHMSTSAASKPTAIRFRAREAHMVYESPSSLPRNEIKVDRLTTSKRSKLRLSTQ